MSTVISSEAGGTLSGWCATVSLINKQTTTNKTLLAPVDLGSALTAFGHAVQTVQLRIGATRLALYFHPLVNGRLNKDVRILEKTYSDSGSLMV